MKRILIILMLLLMPMALAAENPSLSASITKYEPTPASPGKFVTVYVKLENDGDQEAKNVVLEVLPEHPFIIPSGMKATEEVGILNPSSVHIAEFRIKVDEDAVQGTNKLKVRYNLDETRNAWATQELDISVQTLDAILTVKTVETEPDEIVPGESGTVDIVIENIADSLLTDVSVKLDLTDSTIPLVPMNSITEKNIYQMKPGETRRLSFDVIAEPDALADIYKVPVELEYYDNIGTEYTIEDIIGISINSKPEIDVMIDSTSLTTDQTVGNVILKIVNKGLTDVKLMTLKLGEFDDFELLSATKEEYIGNIDSDDFETVEFDVYINGNEKIQMPIEISYRDNNNKPYTETFDLELVIHSREKLSNGGSNLWVIILILVVAGGGYYFYRKRRNAKRSN